MNITDDDIWFNQLRNPQTVSAVETDHLSEDDLEDAKVLGVAISEQIEAFKNEFEPNEEKTQRYLFELNKRGLLKQQSVSMPERSDKKPREYAVAAVVVLFVVTPILYFIMFGSSDPDKKYYGTQVVEQRIEVKNPAAYSAAMVDDLKSIATSVEREKKIEQVQLRQVVFWNVKGMLKNPPDKKTIQFIKSYELDRKKMRAMGSNAIFDIKLTPQ